MGRATLLLVDEDTRTTRRFAAMLEEDGWTVEIYGDIGSAIARLPKPPPFHAILTELVRGVPVHAEARKLALNVPVIFLTNYAEHLARMDLQPRPIIISKPFDYAAFTATLHRAVGFAQP